MAARSSTNRYRQQIKSIVAFLQTLTGKYRGVPVSGRRNEAGAGVAIVSFPRLCCLPGCRCAPSIRRPNSSIRLSTEIDHFATMENALCRDIFSARAGPLRNYDPLVGRWSPCVVRSTDAPRRP